MDLLPIKGFSYDRMELAYELLQGLKNFNSAVVSGKRGSGKTSLLHALIAISQFDWAKNVTYLHGYELDYHSIKLKGLDKVISDERERLIIIEDIDLIRSKKIFDDIFDKINFARRRSNKTVIITGGSYLAEDLGYTYHINMDERRFEGLHLNEMVKKIFSNQNLNDNLYKKIIETLKTVNNNPREINTILNLVNQGLLSSDEEFELYLKERIQYSNSLVENISESKIIIENTPQIITDVKAINFSLINRIKGNPSLVHDLTPRQFEELVAEIFDKKGYQVTLTQQTRDGGKDLMIIQDSLLGNFLCYVECKKFAPSIPVGVRVVRELYGTVAADKATAGIVITSSYFSPDAYCFTEKIKHQMNLIDYNKLSHFLKS